MRSGGSIEDGPAGSSIAGGFGVRRGIAGKCRGGWVVWVGGGGVGGCGCGCGCGCTGLFVWGKRVIVCLSVVVQGGS